MKTKLSILLIALLPILFVSCEKNEILEENTAANAEVNIKTQGQYCGDPTPFVFKNFGGYEVGIGEINNDEEKVYIRFEAPEGFIIRHYLGYIGSVEDFVNRGNVIDPNDPGAAHMEPGNWNVPKVVLEDQGLTFVELEFLLADFPQPQPGECHLIAFVGNFTSDGTDVQWGWATNSSFKSDGYYIDYCLQECTPPETECETAFAYGDQYAYCFRDFKKGNGKYRPNAPANKRFKRWGWTNGRLCRGTYDFELWAGAGQCDLSNGTLVGNVVIEYYGCSATVTYNTLPGYELDETHLYIGNRKIPRKNNGKPTVAPGKYPYKHEGLDGATTDTYTVYGIYGQKNIIAHAVVCPVTQ